MADLEQMAYYEQLLAPYYDLETGAPLHDLDPLPRELAQYQAIKRGQQEGADVQP